MQIRLYPPLWFLMLLILQWVLVRNVPSPSETLMAVRPFGGMMIGAGMAIFAAAVWSFRRHSTTILPFEDTSEQLIKSGIFRMSRNPIYLGEAFILSGTALLSAHGWPWLAPALFVVGIDRNVITWEEKALRRRFGTDFEKYCQKTRRWF
ncbi:MAG: isoprenylcysteine carboxylmethyltransferase family protein [Synoicihabitans sp.]